MRASHVATALAAFTAGLVAASALHHRAGRAVPAPVPAVPAAPDDAREAVVLSFPRRTLAALPAARPAVRPAASPAASPTASPTAQPAARPAAATRCGDSGGITRAGAPCAARATSSGRCHHHPIAA